MQKKYHYFIFGFILTFSQSLIGQENFSNQKKSIESIPFNLTSHNNISIQAVFGSADTINLMFHLAANSVSLTKKATEKMKSIYWDTASDVGSWGGRSTSRYSESNTIKIGNLLWDSVSVWEDENSGPTTGGKFGPHLFEGYAVEIDFEKSLINLHESLPNVTNEYSKIPMVNGRSGFFIQGTSTIDDVEYQNEFLIHTGYGGGILFDDKFAEESNIGERIEIIDVKELKDSFGNVIKVNKGSLPKFSIGNLELTDVPVGFFQGKIGQQQISIIGADILKRFNIIIDSDREFIYLKPNQLINMAYTPF